MIIDVLDHKYAKKIESVLYSSIKGLCIEDYTPSQINAWIRSCQSQINFKFLTLKEKVFGVTSLDTNELMGFVSIENSNLSLLYVHPDHVNKGVGTSLILKAIETIQNLGFKEVTAQVSITAKPLFSKLGFEEVAKRSKFMQSQILVNFEMVYTIPELL